MPALGSAGSGCATAIVQWLTLFSFALYMLTVRAGISVSMGRGVRRQIPGILRLGLPIAAMRGLEIRDISVFRIRYRSSPMREHRHGVHRIILLYKRERPG
jgi:hypothetical protein